MNYYKKNSHNNSFVIDMSHNTIVKSPVDAQEREQDSQIQRNNDLASQELANLYNQGRWTHLEHLIFLACIIHFGRDWKKIELYVQTRSSAQARSHAQKVLKKMDKAGIVREIIQLKSKLKFDPREYKWENLTILSKDADAEAEFRVSPIRSPNASQKMGQNKREIKLSNKSEDQILEDTKWYVALINKLMSS